MGVFKIKALILNDYIKTSYFIKGELDYSHSAIGNSFRRVLKSYNLVEGKDYDFGFIYNDIPEPAKYNSYTKKVQSYKAVPAKNKKEAFAKLPEKLANYDIVITTGPLGVEYFYSELGKKVKGKTVYPSLHSILGHDKTYLYGDNKVRQVLVMAMYSQELVNMDAQRAMPRNLVVRKLALYLKGYWTLNEPRIGKYTIADTVDKVKQVLDVAKKTETSWDTETSSLQPNMPNQKVLCMTLSFKPGTGYYIPLGHRQSPFNKEQLKQVKSLIKDFIDGDNIKVAHNSRFDTNWLLARGMSSHAKNIRDTKIGYWLLVDQSVKETLRLTDLAWSITSMGGYDYPLETYKDWLIYGIGAIAGQLLKLRAKELGFSMKIEDLQVNDVKLNEEDRKTLLSLCDVTNLEESGLQTKMGKTAFPKAVELTKKVIDFKLLTDKVKQDAVDLIFTEINKAKTYQELKKNFTYDWFPIDVMLNYSVGDADCCLRIYKWEKLQLSKSSEKMQFLFNSYYPNFVYTLANIQNNGAHINMDYNKELQNAYEAETKRLLDKLRSFPEVKQLEEHHLKLYSMGVAEMAKKPKERDKKIAKYHTTYKDPEKRVFNPSSDTKELLFDVLGLKLPEDDKFKTSTGMSSAGAETMEYLSDTLDKDSYEYEIIDLLQQYAKVFKIRSSFVDNFPKMVSDVDGCVHGTFNETGTDTSRLSSRNPNLQNVPSSHSDDLKLFTNQYPIKRQYNSRNNGGIIFNCDYSNLELRILGLLSGDKGMYETFSSGKDIHKDTASGAFKVGYDEVTKEQRQAAKKVSFGIIYGIGAQGLANQIGCSVEEAQQFMDTYLDSKPAVERFIKNTQQFGMNNGYIELMSGYRRYLFGMYSNSKPEKSRAMRQTVNTMVQGTGAFLTNTSLIYIQDYLEKHDLNSKLALTVHDSIFGDVFPGEEVDVLRSVKKIMTNLPLDWLYTNINGKKTRYPIDAEMSVGFTYHDLVDYDEDDFKTFVSANGYVQYHSDINLLEKKFESDMMDEVNYNRQINYLKENKSKYQGLSLLDKFSLLK